ncbi:MAG: hypothetical protein OXG72_20550 [Acidobacteria bacterium]|nr:hypothetical protein [Acidobacteriota bacterium]
MPMPIYDPDSEPLDREIRLKLSRRQLFQLDALAAEFGMTRSWFVREALGDGLPVATERLRALARRGLRPSGAARSDRSVRTHRGPRSDGERPDRWAKSPAPDARRRRVRPSDFDDE